jgi:hypothetical protein
MTPEECRAEHGALAEQGRCNLGPSVSDQPGEVPGNWLAAPSCGYMSKTRFFESVPCFLRFRKVGSHQQASLANYHLPHQPPDSLPTSSLQMNLSLREFPLSSTPPKLFQLQVITPSAASKTTEIPVSGVRRL